MVLLILLCLIFLNTISFAMITLPFDTLLSETPSTVNLKYVTNNIESKFMLPFMTSTTLGQVKMTKVVTSLDADNYEVTYNLQPLESNTLLKHLEIEFDMELSGQVMMAEGFQCWSTTKEMDRYSKLAAIPRVVSWITQFNLQGDYDFFNYSNQPGHIHSTGYTYLRHTQSDHVVFFGSVSESSGYTYFKSDLNNNRFSIYKDIDGRLLSKGDTLSIKVLVSQRNAAKDLRSIWNLYGAYYDPKHEFKNPRHLTGWSSWYNFYERVTEKDVNLSLDAFKKHKYPIDVFQIDDGFQQKIGDWLDVNTEKFPRGMKVIADEIKQQNYIPGIWLAPYAVGFESKIVHEHPEWILKHADGSFVVAGPNWGGFYAIDIYHTEARAYLQHVFDQVIDIWGFKLLKLDFLFAAAMIPRLGKSRGEIMWDAMDLIVQFTQKRALTLGSGVTLPSTWGRLDYSRVSSDASPWWDHSVLRIANVRERVATANAIVSTINRWAMASVVFGSDPDVFFIRSDNNKLTKEEKHTLLIVNIIFGQLTLMSDNVDLYNKQEHKLYSSIFPKPEAVVQEVRSIGNDIYQVIYTCYDREYVFMANLSPLPFTAQLPLSKEGEYEYFFEHTNVLVNGSRVDWLKSQARVFLMPHETRSYMKLTSPKEPAKDRFMGSTGHIVPGSEVESFVEHGKEVHITLKKPHMPIKNRIYVKLDSNESGLPVVYVDGKLISRVERVVWNEHVSVAKVTIYEQS